MAITCCTCGCVVEDTKRFNIESICRDCAGIAPRWRIVAWLGDGPGVVVRHDCGYSTTLETIEVLAGVIETCNHCGQIGILERRRDPEAASRSAPTSVEPDLDVFGQGHDDP